MIRSDPTDHALATIASILDPPECRRETEKVVARRAKALVPPPLPVAPAPIEAHGYSRHGPGPMASIRFKWTVRLENGDYYVDETIGENSTPVVNGPMSREAAIQMVNDRESDARRRFEQLKSEMSGLGAAVGPQQRRHSIAYSQALSRRPQKILLGKVDTGVAQDVIGGRDMKKELRDAERQQYRFSGEFLLGAVLESEGDFLVGCGFDLGARQALHKIDRCRDPRLEFGDIRLAIWKCMRRTARQQRAGNDGMPVSFSHLLLQAVHGGREPHVQKDGGIDVSGFGMGLGVIEKTGQIPQIRHEHADGSF